MSTSDATARPQRDRAYEALREALILQQVQAGTRLSEPAWAKRLGVGRVAVREAFARLEAEGLIVRAPTVGYVVPQLDAKDIEEIIDVRLALEAAAIERVCARGRPDRASLAPLEEAVEQQAAFVEQGYRLGASEADRRFHHRLVALSGNRRLVELYCRAPLPLIHRLTMPPGPPSRRPVEEHRRIIEALAAGDAHRARRLLEAHLRTGMQPRGR